MRSALVPEEFAEARLDNFRRDTPVQVYMHDSMSEYLEGFEENKNSFGFLAVFGEKRFLEIRDLEYRAMMKQKHNNVGIGKSHLTIAAAKDLTERRHNVLCISDVAFMDELSQARTMDDNGERYNELLDRVLSCDVLVWDDIGKRSTEARKAYYYRIIDAFYRAGKRIIFSSNEDPETLAEQIGDAAASRLLGMAKGFVFTVEGVDQR